MFLTAVLLSSQLFAQDFPYSEMLKMTDAELVSAKFKYNKKHNQWILHKSEGQQAAKEATAPLSATNTAQPQADDCTIVIKKGAEGVASVDVRFYNRNICLGLLNFAKDFGENLREDTSGALRRLLFEYKGYSFVLQMKTQGRTSVVKTLMERPIKVLDETFSIYDLTITTGIEPVSPYLTKRAAAEKDDETEKEDEAK